MQTHVWIKDDFDMDFMAEIEKRYYVDTRLWIKPIWGGYDLTGTYQGQPVEIKCVRTEDANKHVQHSLFCGIEVQKIIVDSSRVHPAVVMYLYSRIRSKDICPQEMHPVKGAELVLELNHVYKGINRITILNKDRMCLYDPQDNKLIQEFITDALW